MTSVVVAAPCLIDALDPLTSPHQVSFLRNRVDSSALLSLSSTDAVGGGALFVTVLDRNGSLGVVTMDVRLQGCTIVNNTAEGS
jgi:hypothetical protein